MRKYAEGTTVDAHGTQFDIMKTLSRFGVGNHAFGTQANEDGTKTSSIAFAHGGLTYRIAITIPSPKDKRFQLTDQGRQRAPKAAEDAYNSEERRLWRSLLAVIKAKLIAVDDQITTFEKEFLPYIITGDGRTVGEVLVPQLQKAALEGNVPSALPMPGVPPNG